MQENLPDLVAHPEHRVLRAGLAEGVLAELPVKGIKRANKDDIGLPQLCIELASVEHVHVHHGLIDERHSLLAQLYADRNLVGKEIHFGDFR